MEVILLVVYLKLQENNIRTWEWSSLRACEIAAEFVQQNQEVKAVCIENGSKKQEG